MGRGLLVIVVWTAALEITPMAVGQETAIPRVRLIHSADPEVLGGTSSFIQHDPWLAYLWGRDLVTRTYQARDGWSPRTDSLITSCADCHAVAGRGTLHGIGPHLFGIGLLEMLAAQASREILSLLDENEDGWVSLSESPRRRVFIRSRSRDKGIFFGNHADADKDGRPDLNPVIQIRYVDARGQVIPGAESLNHPRVAGYIPMLAPFAHPRHGRLRSSTLRHTLIGAFHREFDLQAHDPTTHSAHDRLSLSGAHQPREHSPDPGHVLGPNGLSLDDPDGDQVIHEITEGDLDVMEWFLLNSPRPGRQDPDDKSRAGELMFERLQCSSCHRPHWDLRATEEPTIGAGDRRFFDLTAYRLGSEQAEATLKIWRDRQGIRPSWPRGFQIEGIYTDLRIHDLGAAYAPGRGRYRVTRALWGVGSTAPYGFDGQSPSLHDAIMRHGGDADASKRRYVAATERQKASVIAFLKSLQLFDPEAIPADINRNGRLEKPFRTQFQVLPWETFWPEHLCERPGMFELREDTLEGGLGAPINAEEVYGLDLGVLRDRDRDGFPDIIDACPDEAGILDGCANNR